MKAKNAVAFIVFESDELFITPTGRKSKNKDTPANIKKYLVKKYGISVVNEVKRFALSGASLPNVAELKIYSKIKFS